MRSPVNQFRLRQIIRYNKDNMRLALLIFVLVFTGCGQFKSSTQPKEENNKLIAEAQTQNVLNAINAKPAWLFSGDACPADVMPKQEAEIKYLGEGCANNPEECLNKCRENDANACYALAVLLDEKLYNEKRELDKKITPPLYLRACKLGIVSGCTNYAASKTNFEKMDAATTACVANSFEKTCAKDDAWGCAMYGQILNFGIGRPQDTIKALEILQKVCNITEVDDPACVESKELQQIIRNEQSSTNANINTTNSNAIHSSTNVKNP